MKRLIAIVLLMLLPVTALAQSEATEPNTNGSFANWITDMCWACLFPITIGSVELPIDKLLQGGFNPSTEAENYLNEQGVGLASGDDDGHPSNTEGNPAIPVCVCPPLKCGLTMGWWEPRHRIEVNRKPFCFTSLGFCIPISIPWSGGWASRGYPDGGSGNRHSETSTHLVIDIAFKTLDIISDFPCMKKKGGIDIPFDILFLSEVDPTWRFPGLSCIFSPWACILTNNIIAQAVCAIDCIAASISKPLKFLYWCQGCQGGLGPYQGNNTESKGAVYDSVKAAQNMVAKTHVMGLLWRSWGSSALCGQKLALAVDKTAYRLAMAGPRAQTGTNCCQPLGRTTEFWSVLREFPVKGEDPRYWLFQKVDCCVTVSKYNLCII